MYIYIHIVCVFTCACLCSFITREFSAKHLHVTFWGMYESVLYGLFHDGFYDCSVHGLSCFSGVQLFATPQTVVHQAPLSMGYFQQKYWIGLLFPPRGDLPNPGIEPSSPVSPARQVDSLPLSQWESTQVSFV